MSTSYLAAIVATAALTVGWLVRAAGQRRRIRQAEQAREARFEQRLARRVRSEGTSPRSGDTRWR